MKPDHRQFIKNNYQRLSAVAIAKKLNIRERKVNKYICSLEKQLQETARFSIAPRPRLFVVAFAAIFMVGLLSYANTFSAEFQFDDHHYIVNNPTIKNIDNLHQFRRLPPTIRMRYVAFYTFALNYAWGGLDVTGYHIVNLSIHILTSCFVFWLGYLVFLTPRCREQKMAKHKFWIALCAALMFVAHPLQTQAVTYITQRFASLATMFYVGGMCFYLTGRLRKNVWPFAVALLFAVLGMFTKQTVITLPIMVVLTEIVLFESAVLKRPQGIALLAILFCIGLIVPALHKFNLFGILSIQVPSESHFGDILNARTYLYAVSCGCDVS